MLKGPETPWVTAPLLRPLSAVSFGALRLRQPARILIPGALGPEDRSLPRGTSLPSKLRQPPFASLDWLAPDVFAIDLQKVEGDERNVPLALAQQIEVAKPIFGPGGDDLPVDQAGRHV